MTSGNRADNLRRAIDCYNAALRVRTEAAFPEEHELTVAKLRRAQQLLDDLEA